jgi:hypothetical protein
MLGVSALLLAVSALANGRELARHLLDGPSQLGKLAGNRRYVLSGCHTKVDTILRGSDGTSASRRSCNAHSDRLVAVPRLQQHERHMRSCPLA